MKKETQEAKETPKPKVTLESLPGIGLATVDKLQTVGYRTVMSIAVANTSELIDATGMTMVAVKKAIAAARAAVEMNFTTADKYEEVRAKVMRIKTGSEAFDKLLDGGFETGAITECFGEFGSGKTQMGHILAVNSQLLKDDKGPVYTVYIDTESTFRPGRIRQLAKGAGLDEEKTLKSIVMARAFDTDHQMLLAEKVADLIIKKKMNVRLIVIDSLTAHFRAEYSGRGTLADRQQKLNRHLRTLLKLAEIHNLAVYVTNQVMAKPDMLFGDPTIPIGGHIVGHACTFRIYMRKGKKGSRVAKLIDSPSLPDGECSFFIETSGLKDIK